MLFMSTMHVQPDCIMQERQSHEHWIMAQQSLSPERQVKMTPSVVISHLHTPMVKLQVVTTMPFMRQQQEHMLPAIILQRFCNMLAAILSSQMQWIFMPPVVFSKRILQRGTMVGDGAAWPGDMGMVAPIMPGMVMPLGFIMVVAIHRSPYQEAAAAGGLQTAEHSAECSFKAMPDGEEVFGWTLPQCRLFHVFNNTQARRN
jgi:hypothetical protein